MGICSVEHRVAEELKIKDMCIVLKFLGILKFQVYRVGSIKDNNTRIIRSSKLILSIVESQNILQKCLSLNSTMSSRKASFRHLRFFYFSKTLLKIHLLGNMSMPSQGVDFIKLCLKVKNPNDSQVKLFYIALTIHKETLIF